MRHAFVIPAYKDSPHLPACIESILAQTLPGSALVITTSTPSVYLTEVSTHYRIPLLENSGPDGIGNDWNAALLATNASHVTIAHQDDCYWPAYWQRMSALLKHVPDATMAFCDFVETSAAGERPLHLNLRIKRHLVHRCFRDRDALHKSAEKRRLLAWGNPIGCHTVVINRRQVPDFRFSTEFASNLDWDGWLRLANSPGSFAYLPEVLTVRRIHESSETSALLADRRRVTEDRRMFRRFWPRPVAESIAFVYRMGYLANRT